MTSVEIQSGPDDRRPCQRGAAPPDPARDADCSGRLLGAAFPLAAGLMLYGWRAAIVVGGVMISAAAAAAVWRRVGARGGGISFREVFYLALLMGLMLPAHLGTLAALPGSAGGASAWLIIPLAGILIVVIRWLIAGMRYPPVHPVLGATLVLAAMYAEELRPRAVLHPLRAGIGDLMAIGKLQAVAGSTEEPWFRRQDSPEADALYVPTVASHALTAYTAGMPGRRALKAIEAMLRDDMPPLEDLVVGGHPAPIGAGSAVGTIIGGLFLLYFRAANYHIPLGIVLTAASGFALAPALLMPGAQADWATSLVFSAYEILGTPLLLISFFLATAWPAGGERSPWARTLFVFGAGLLTVAFQLYWSAPYGASAALALTWAADAWLGRGGDQGQS